MKQLFSNFLVGFGSVFNLAGTTVRSSIEEDQIALERDWEAVGNDIRDAMEGVRPTLRGTPAGP